MFYMFSGPDFLYADAFYPKATTYVLSALEPTGQVPDLTRLPRGGVGAALYNVERSLGSILSFSFFITKQMKTDLSAGQISGTLPILYVFLARSGKTIRSVTPVALDDKGQGLLRQRESRTQRRARRAHHVRRQRWRREDAVLFLDRSLQQRRQVERLPEVLPRRLAPGNSLIKSASYLLHSGNFTTVRDYILANSATIIQDDSGVPLTYYNSEAMALLPVRPLPRPDRRIPRTYQQSYADLFRRAEPINFGIGYRWRTNESNLLLSVKTADGSAPVETTSSADAASAGAAAAEKAETAAAAAARVPLVRALELVAHVRSTQAR